MHPVEDRNLYQYLNSISMDLYLREKSLMGFFGCLVAALAHIHKNSILHKDIKSNNVVNKGGSILLIDIGNPMSCFDTCAETTEEPKDGKSQY